MRSHPYRAPPPLPPLLDELSTYLPNRDGRRANDDTEIPLSDFNPDTSSLLPRKRRQHRVRVQGRLALVRSVSVANLNASTGIPSPRDSIARFDTGITGKSRRRRSIDAVSDMEEDVEERDTQFRGYGIGGAGNIRRPTDVMGTPRGSSSISSLFSSSSSAPTSPLGPSLDKKKWNFAEFLGRIGDQKGKEKVTA